MRVVRVITRLNVGGPAIQAMTLSDRLAPRGFETVLVHGQLDAGEGDMLYLLSPTVDVRYLAALGRPLAPAHDSLALVQLLDVMREVRPQIVHTHTAKAGTLGRLAAVIYNRTAGRRDRTRVVHTYHGHVLDGYFSPAKTRMFLGAERMLARATDRIVAISPRIKTELLEHYRIGRPDQYRVVPLGFDLASLAAIDDDARAKARAALQIPPGAAVVTTVGRLTAIKQQRLFLEAAQRIAGANPAVAFLIVGDGDLRTELEASASTFGLAGRVRFLGWRRDLETIYGATDVFLLTSRNEGTPVALIESMAAGCAGVSTNVGGVGDVLTSTDIGLTAPFGDVGQLAGHVNGLFADPVRRRLMADAGRRAVIVRYGVDRLVGDIDALYRELLG